MCSVSQLPWDKEPPLATDFHALESLVKAGDQAAKALNKSQRLRFAHFGFAAGVQLGLAILSHHLSCVVIRRVKLAASGGEPAGVVHFVDLVRFSFFAGADPDVLIAQRKRDPYRDMSGWNSRRQFDGV